MNSIGNLINMKKVIFPILTAAVIGLTIGNANAQMADGQGFSNFSVDWNEVVEHTLREEKEGKELWDKFRVKEVACADLNDEQFSVLGEYFMGQMMGESHAAMNAMMMQMHGKEGEKQIHIVMGKRLSGCDTSAVASGLSGGWMPMMNMMMGEWSFPFGSNQSNNSMMNFGFGSFGFFGWIFMILFWVLILLGLIALIKWLVNQVGSGNGQKKSALDIAKERYAKGEITKEEFEKIKKDLLQ